MPVLTPANASSLEVTLAEVLAARQSALGEKDLWNVLYAACCSLNDYLQQGNEQIPWSQNGLSIKNYFFCIYLDSIPCIYSELIHSDFVARRLLISFHA